MKAKKPVKAKTQTLGSPHSLNDYTLFTRTTVVYPGRGTGRPGALSYCALGLAGEAGEVAGKVSKLLRDGDSEDLRAKIVDELGDVMWFWARLCEELGVQPDAVLAANMGKLTDRMARGTIGGSGDSR